MSKDREVFYRKDMVREATDMTDRAGRLDGFKRGSPQWNRYYQNYLYEMERSVNPHATKENPTVSEHIVFASYPQVYGVDGFIAQHLGSSTSDEARRYRNRIESAINNLNSIFLEIVMQMRTRHENGKYSDFDVPKAADENLKKKVYLNQYTRMTTLSLLYAVLKPFFNTEKSDVASIINNSNIKELDSRKLHEPQNRIYYSKALTERIAKILFKKTEIK
jgi:hypothetical protein